MRRKKKIPIHQRINHHLSRHFHRHVHKILHVTNFLHHHIFHSLELIIITIVTITSFGFSNLSWINQEVFRSNTSEVLQALLAAMQNPKLSLKQGNIISVRNIDMDVENSFAKWYCTYGAARMSPEFFPYIDPKTQQRTWWGNAVDRCKNAADTWYRIWVVPMQWALIVYDAWGKFWSYGHVGKVLHYDKTFNKLIVRDMARVARWSMSDRREDLATANVKCYIYNNKINAPIQEEIVPPAYTGSVLSTWTVITTGTTVETTVSPISTWTSQPIQETITNPVSTPVIAPTPPQTPETPISVQTPITEPVVQPIVSQNSVNKTLALTLENLSDIAQHFITQNNLALTLTTKTPLMLGQAATLTLEIRDKQTGDLYNGLLPFAFTILSTNDSLQPDISNIQMINNGLVTISIVGQNIGTAAIVILMDDVRIGEFSLDIN